MSTRTIIKPTAKSATETATKPLQPKARKVVAPPEPEVIIQVAGSKQSHLITLLHSPSGGTVSDMMTLTGWQAHTVRGVISGVLRKKLGLTVQCAFGADLTTRVYRIVESSAATL